MLTDVTYYQLQSENFHFSHACIHSHPLSQVSSSNHHHCNRTSVLGRFGSIICQTCSTHGNWAPDKSLKAYYYMMHPLCVLKSTSPVTAPNVHLCVPGRRGKNAMCEPVHKCCLIKLSLHLLQQGPHHFLSISLLG